MDIPEILRQLATCQPKFPEDAMRAAVAAREAITPHLLAILQETVERAEEFADENGYIAHLSAMCLLAQFREPRAYPLVVRFALLPDDTLEALAGEFVCETLPRVLASVCDGGLEPIFSLIEDASADEWARVAGLDSLVTLVAEGAQPRDVVIDYFRSLYQGKLRREPAEIWNALAGASADVYPGELIGEIERAYAEDLVDPGYVGLDEIHQDLDAGKEHMLAKLKANPHHHFVDDAAADMRWWAFLQDEAGPAEERALPAVPVALPPLLPPKPAKTGRNEPCPCGSGRKFKKCCGA